MIPALVGAAVALAPANLPATAPGKETRVRLLKLATPLFPPRAAKAGWEAAKSHTVRLQVEVDAAGRAQQVNILQGVPGPWGFDESALQTALGSSYAPATRDGHPVTGTLAFTVTFKAQGRKPRAID